MLKKFTFIVSILTVSVGTLFAQATKVAVVNMEVVIERFSETPALLADLQADVQLIQNQQKEFTNQLRKKQEDLQNLVKEMENPLNSEKVKAEKRQEANALNRQILRDRQEMENTILKMRRSLEEKRLAGVGKIVQKILPHIQNFMKENDIGILIDSSKNTVVYASPENEVTEQISELLTKEFPPKEDTVPAPSQTLTPAVTETK